MAYKNNIGLFLINEFVLNHRTASDVTQSEACWPSSEKPVPCFKKNLRAATNESQKTRNKKQNGLAHLRFLVCVTPKQQQKKLLDSRIKFLAKRVK